MILILYKTSRSYSCNTRQNKQCLKKYQLKWNAFAFIKVLFYSRNFRTALGLNFSISCFYFDVAAAEIFIYSVFFIVISNLQYFEKQGIPQKLMMGLRIPELENSRPNPSFFNLYIRAISVCLSHVCSLFTPKWLILAKNFTSQTPFNFTSFRLLAYSFWPQRSFEAARGHFSWLFTSKHS